MRRLFLGVSLACFIIGTVCFFVFFARAAWLIVQMPSIDVEQALRHMTPIQAWWWWFFGLYSAGFVIVYCVSDRVRPGEAGQAAAADDAEAGCGRAWSTRRDS
jgi:hypothetical protein